MRKLIFLKTLLDFLFLFLVLGVVVIVVFMLVFPFLEKAEDLTLTINGNEYQTLDAGVVTIMVFMALAYAIFVYCVFWLRKIVRSFMKTKLFDEQVIKGFNRVGIGFIGISLFVHVPEKVYMIFNNAHVRTHFTLISGTLFDTFLFMLSLGLFFMVLGTVFKIAKHAKEENELTV